MSVSPRLRFRLRLLHVLAVAASVITVLVIQRVYVLAATPVTVLDKSLRKPGKGCATKKVPLWLARLDSDILVIDDYCHGVEKCQEKVSTGTVCGYCVFNINSGTNPPTASIKCYTMGTSGHCDSFAGAYGPLTPSNPPNNFGSCILCQQTP